MKYLVRLIYLAALVLNVIHPLIHGTFLDGGALDSSIQALDVWVMSNGHLR